MHPLSYDPIYTIEIMVSKHSLEYLKGFLGATQCRERLGGHIVSVRSIDKDFFLNERDLKNTVAIEFLADLE